MVRFSIFSHFSWNSVNCHCSKILPVKHTFWFQRFFVKVKSCTTSSVTCRKTRQNLVTKQLLLNSAVSLSYWECSRARSSLCVAAASSSRAPWRYAGTNERSLFLSTWLEKRARTILSHSVCSVLVGWRRARKRGVYKGAGERSQVGGR